MSFALPWLASEMHLLASVLLFALHLAVAARAITRPGRTPASRVAWVAVIAFMPLLGMLAYLMLGETSIGHQRVRRLRAAQAALALPDDAAFAPSQAQVPMSAPFDLARAINGFAPVAGNGIALMADSNVAIDTLVADIHQARETVHISFYIWLDDGNGGKVADAVAAAAARGVRCRVMVDALGSRSFIRSGRWAQLREAGVHVHAALNDIPRVGRVALGRIDLRNHRKIVVIDNRIAYCGSQNCADPAFRVKARFAPWVDIFFRCDGPVVRQMQWLFLVVWVAETGEALDTLGTALPAATPSPVCAAGGAVAQVFGTGPTGRRAQMSDMFVTCLCAAQHELIVTTPYFVPDEALLRALCAAPQRGVKTTVIFPLRNDSWLVGHASRSCYAALLEAGVAVYEYPLGLLHSKSITVDGRMALVGSANMDRRSLELNDENNLLIADPGVTGAIRERQLSYLAVSRPVAADTVRGWSFGRRLVQNTVAMMAPVL